MAPPACREVVEFVIAEARASDYRMDLRYMEKSWQDYRLWKHGKSRNSWQDLVRSSMKRIVAPRVATSSSRASQKAMEQELVRDIYRRYPKDKSKRDRAWSDCTGKGADSLYRRARELKTLGLL